MKWLMVLVTLCLLAGSLVAQQLAPSRDESEIQKIIDNFETAYRTKDGALWAKFLAEDADFMQAFGRYLKGRSQIQKFMSGFISDQTDSMQGREIGRRIQLVKPDVAFAEMTEEISGIRNADGTVEPPRRGHLMVVLRKDGTNWKIIHYRYLDIHTGALR
jgi:uncharacterized protein (TIGR02246 family)